MIRRTPRFVHLSLRVFSILVGLAALLCAGQAFRRTAHLFREPPARVYLQEFRAQLRTVEDRIPAGAFVLHLSASPEYWQSRLWQRALYPRNEAIVVQPPWGPELLRRLRAKYGVRYALSAGNPPSDPGYLWSIDLGRLPGHSGGTWFGELTP